MPHQVRAQEAGDALRGAVGAPPLRDQARQQRPGRLPEHGKVVLRLAWRWVGLSDRIAHLKQEPMTM